MVKNATYHQDDIDLQWLKEKKKKAKTNLRPESGFFFCYWLLSDLNLESFGLRVDNFFVLFWPFRAVIKEEKKEEMKEMIENSAVYTVYVVLIISTLMRNTCPIKCPGGRFTTDKWMKVFLFFSDQLVYLIYCPRNARNVLVCSFFSR